MVRVELQRLNQQIRAGLRQPLAQFESILFGTDFGFPFEQHVAGVEPGVDAHGRNAGARFAIGDGPLDGRRAAIFRQQGRVHINDARAEECR